MTGTGWILPARRAPAAHGSEAGHGGGCPAGHFHRATGTSAWCTGEGKTWGIHPSAKRDSREHPHSPAPLQTFPMRLPTPAQRVRAQRHGTRPQHACTPAKSPLWSRALFSPGKRPGLWVGGREALLQHCLPQHSRNERNTAQRE